MDTPILSSTFFLTLLLSVGLFFFIRASVKDRTEQLKFVTDRSQESAIAQLQEYFDRRAYRVAAVDAAQNQVTFEGFVRPSWFLAIFLTLLAAIGMVSLALVLSMLLPQGGSAFLGLILLSPIAGLFYWKKAGRLERVSLQIQPLADAEDNADRNMVTVTGHRDELAVLKQTLGLPVSE